MTMPARGDGTRNGKFDVVFVLPHMGRGGAQRVVSLVANAWAKEGRRVCILTWLDGREEAHQLAPEIVRLTLDHHVMARHERLPWWSWEKIRVRVRRFERRVRPYWPWRTIAQSVGTPDTSVFSDVITVLSGRMISRRMRTRLAEKVAALGESVARQRNPDAAAQIAERRAPAWVPLAESILGSDSFRRVMSALLLDWRVQAFRRLFLDLDVPVLMSLLTRTNLYVLEATRGLPHRVVISERNDPERQRLDPAWSMLRSISYKKADAVTANSAGALAGMAGMVPADKLRMLPNPVTIHRVPERRGVRDKKFTTVARLVHQKGIDILLRAFASVTDDAADWSLEIVGDGPLRNQLEALAIELGIADRAIFRGYLEDPIGVLLSSRIFVLPSRFEGMPNSLLEAMACELAPIISDASPGPLECVIHDESGIVVAAEDVGQLADAMRRLARDERLTERLARRAALYVREHDWSIVEPEWIEVLGLAPKEETQPQPAERDGHPGPY
jgi:glycosyltransferase involved in cell wall biosynthesis